MVRSVAIKAGMLSATLGLMWGMGWPVVDSTSGLSPGEVPVPPAKLQTADSNMAGSVSETRVNVNSGTVRELESLPGIGPVLAGRIVNYRAQHGRFSSVHELKRVPGIGSGRLSKILPLITLNQLPTDQS